MCDAMFDCLLRAGMSRLLRIDQYVLGTSKAWLGTAYHKVLERLPELAAAGADLPIVLDSFWHDEIGRLEAHALHHPLNRRFGQARFWRGYHLVMETLRLRVAELVAGVSSNAPQVPVTPIPKAFREASFVAFGGKLKGKPDLARGDEIVDFKTGSIFESDDIETPPELKHAYVRQLHIYAYLLHQTAGHWPRRGLLYPVAGPPVTVDLEPNTCIQEAQDAVAQLDRYNSAVAGSTHPAELASPSPETCKWCPFKAICPAFWVAANEEWSGNLDGESAKGRLVSPPQPVFAGSAFSLSVEVEAGTAPRASTVLSSFPSAVHPDIPSLHAGDRVLITGLGRRATGVLIPTMRTVVLTEAAAAACL
jgi:hypothetical protein